MRVFYSDHYTIELPEGHRFPMRKYRLLRQALVEQGIIDTSQLHAPELASREDVLLAHTQRYVDGVMTGTLERLEQRRIGFPWSQGLVDRSLATVGGCLASARAALEDGLSGNLAGGTHHAMRDAGEGFCVFNDIAVATLKLMQEGRVRRVAIVDLDVHQGNGNSEVLGGRNDVVSFRCMEPRTIPSARSRRRLMLICRMAPGMRSFLKWLNENSHRSWTLLPTWCSINVVSTRWSPTLLADWRSPSRGSHAAIGLSWRPSVDAAFR